MLKPPYLLFIVLLSKNVIALFNIPPLVYLTLSAIRALALMLLMESEYGPYPGIRRPYSPSALVVSALK